MQPDNYQQPAPGYSPMPQQPTYNVPSPRKRSRLPMIFIGLLVIVTMALGGIIISQNSTLASKNNELKQKQVELDETKDQLATAQSKLDDLAYSPQKQINDAKRKNDLARFMATATEYAANNNGTFPSTEPTFFAKDFEQVYITGKLSDFIDPDTKKPYTFTPVAKVQTPPGVTLGNIQYQWPGKCSGSEFDDSATERQAAARMILESGEIYCLEN